MSALAGPVGPQDAGKRVVMRNGIVGLLLWAYENPVWQPGYEDRACIDVGGSTWGASLGDLRLAES